MPPDPAVVGHEALAYLAGGWQRLAQVAVLRLYRLESVVLDPVGGRLKQRAPLRADATAAETAVHRAAGFMRAVASADIDAATKEIEAGLMAQGLWLSPAQKAARERIWGRISGLGLALTVLLLGCATSGLWPLAEVPTAASAPVLVMGLLGGLAVSVALTTTAPRVT